MGEDALDSDEALGLRDFHPDACIATVGLRVEGRKLLRRKQDAIRIIELVDQTASGLLVEGRRVDGIDEAGRDDVQDLVEEPGALLAFTLLKYEASDHERDQDEAEEQSFSGSRHYKLGMVKVDPSYAGARCSGSVGSRPSP